MNAQREQNIRWAVEECISDLVEAQAAGTAPEDRGSARVLNTLHEHNAQLMQPPPQLFRALELPEEFAQSLSTPVPVPTTAGEQFLVTVRVTLISATYYEDWRGGLLGAEPAGNHAEFDALRRRMAELVEAARIERAAAAEAVPPLPPTPAPASDEDEREAVRRRAHALASGDERVLHALLSHTAPSVRLRPDDAAKRRSRFGGVPFLPPRQDWPRRSFGRPLHFLAQLDMREVPRTSLTESLPAEGMLAFFYDGDHMPWGIEAADADGFKVLYLPPDVELAPAQPPADTPDDFVRPAAGIRFELDATVNVYQLPLDSAQQDAIAERRGDEPAHRLLGEPEAIQGDPREEVLPDTRGTDWQLLLQLDSGEPLGFDFGDSGRIYFLIRALDLAEQRWERCWLLLQCH